MKHKFARNMGLKMMALAFAAILWFVVVNVDDPVTSAVYREIPISIINDEVITNEGKVYQVKDEIQTVNVTVNARRSELSKIKDENIVVTADVSQMEVNTMLVPVTATIPGLEGKYQSAETNPNNLQIKIEDVTKNNFPISVSATGTPRDGYVIGEMTSNPEKVVIKGPKSVVDSIEKVVAKIDVSGLAGTSVQKAELILYDSNYNVISQAPLKNNLGEDGVSVNVQVLHTKNIKLDFGISGAAKDGYVCTGWSSVPEMIQVCGTKEALDNLKTLEIPRSEIDISGADKSREVTVDIQPYLPEGVKLVDETANNVIVRVVVEPGGARVIELPIESVRMKNLAENLTAVSVEGQDLELTFRGPEEILKVLDISNAASVDLKDYTTPGKYVVPVEIDTAEGIILADNPTVTIELREKKSEGE